MSEKTGISALLKEIVGVARHLPRGEVLFEEGDKGDSFYVVENGRLRAFRRSENESPVIVGEIGRGELVGEMAVLGDTVRSASIVAVRDSRVVEVSGTDLQQLPREVLLEVLRILTQRIRRMLDHKNGEALPSCIAVVPAGNDVPLDAYSQRLLESLGNNTRKSTLLRAGDIPSEFAALIEPVGHSFHRLGHWLDERESEVDTLLLQCDFTLTPWTRRCLNQADLVLLVALADSDPSKGPIEEALDQFSRPEARPRMDLVLLQKSLPYRGTARWLEKRTIGRHYHVRLDSTSDKERAGRLLAGNDVSFAFGGGGARGFAHIGILRACEELDIPVDRVCGTSIGAIIGGLAAMGLGADEITEVVRENFPPKRRLFRYTFPILSIYSANSYVKLLDRLYGDTQIEDLPINYFCVSCNLSRATLLQHRSGSLAKWVSASMSIPGLAPPLIENGELIVDGALLNNLPVDIARQDGAGLVVGVDVSSETEFCLATDYCGRPHALETLTSWLPWKRRAPSTGERTAIPSIVGILNRATTLSSVYHKESLKSVADCYIRVPVDGFKLLGFENLDALSERGYQTGLERLAGIARVIENREQDESSLAGPS